LCGKLATYEIIPNGKKMTMEIKLQEGAVLSTKELKQLEDIL
jgi:hypothetical protein